MWIAMFAREFSGAYIVGVSTVVVMCARECMYFVVSVCEYYVSVLIRRRYICYLTSLCFNSSFFINNNCLTLHVLCFDVFWVVLLFYCVFLCFLVLFVLKKKKKKKKKFVLFVLFCCLCFVSKRLVFLSKTVIFLKKFEFSNF